MSGWLAPVCPLGASSFVNISNPTKFSPRVALATLTVKYPVDINK